MAGEQPARLPPHDLDSEESLLGAMMLTADACRAADHAGITAADFYKPAHAAIYTAICAVIDEGGQPDPITVAAHLNGHGTHIGGREELLRLQVATPASANAPSYAHIVREHARRRELIAISTELQTAAYEGRDVERVLERAQDHSIRRPNDALIPVAWHEAFVRRTTHADWLVEPVIPLGAQVLLYAPKKTGKSLLILEIVAALATGRRLFDQPAADPQPVLVVDFENSVEEDVVPRLEDLGYTPDQLEHLHFYSFPPIRPLDTDAGARRLEELIVRHRPCLVVLDSFQRIVGGPENDADTVRAYYQHTGFTLKRHKVTSVRLDNTGKDETAGARGSSAKGDDVDLIWRLRPMENGFKLTRDAQRGTLAPEEINLQRIDTLHLHHRVVNDSWPAGTQKLVDTLDRLGFPPNISQRDARARLRESGEPAKQNVLAAALKYRRTRSPEERVSPRVSLPADTTISENETAGITGSDLGVSFGVSPGIAVAGERVSTGVSKRHPIPAPTLEEPF